MRVALDESWCAAVIVNRRAPDVLPPDLQFFLLLLLYIPFDYITSTSLLFCPFYTCGLSFILFLAITAGIVANWLIPDHDADAFRLETLQSPTSSDRVVHFLFDGFNKWDGSYYLAITQDGYTQPQMFAFFPLFPALVRFIALPVSFICVPELLSFRSCLMVSSWLVNTVLFVVSAILIQKLAARIMKDDRMAHATAILFCINPASVFMSATYTETLFTTLTFGGMIAFHDQSFLVTALLFGLSAAVRSNGAVLFGFLIYHWTQTLIRGTLLSLSTGRTNILLYVVLQSLKAALILIGLSTLVFGPFLLFQVYSYLRICHSTKFDLPNLFFGYLLPINSAVDNIPSSVIPQWCHKTLPVPYSSIQSEVWEVGFLNYFQLQKIPNFILALPVLILGVRAVMLYCQENWGFVRCLGLAPRRKTWDKYARSQGFYNDESFLHLAHLAFLMIFGVLFMHIEVLTRFLFSSSPVLLMFAAHLTTTGPDSSFFKGQPPASIWDTFKCILGWAKNGPWSKFVLIYFFLYFFLGLILHCNFLPWT